jgi:hypothetical protein
MKYGCEAWAGEPLMQAGAPVFSHLELLKNE